MRCAVTFLCVLSFLVVIGSVAFLILWTTRDKCPPKSFFRCPGSSVCVPNSWLCNDVHDCPNGDDEDVLICENVWSVVAVLSCNRPLKKNHTKTLDCELECPGGCQCNVTTGRVHCSNTRWRQVPWDSFKCYIKRLIFENSFHPGESEETSIEHRWEDSASTIRDLEYLEILKSPWLRTMPLKLFKSNPKLKWITMRGTALEEINSEAFHDLKHLIIIDLAGNQLQRIHGNPFLGLDSLTDLELPDNQLDLKNWTFPKLNLLGNLNLSANYIEEIGPDLFQNLSNLCLINLRKNHIKFIHPDAFRGNLRLVDLDISDNWITSIKDNFFWPELVRLSIAFNWIEPSGGKPNLTPKNFNLSSSLKSLDLDGIDAEAIDRTIFRNLVQLRRVNFKKFPSCKWVPSAYNCSPSSDGLSSFENLLNGLTLRISIWIVAFLIIVLNIWVLTRRLGESKPHAILDIMVSNLAVADLLMGFYLVVIAFKDITYRHHFNPNALEWASSAMCSVIGIVAMISTEVSLMILAVISLERYLVISGPFGSSKLKLSKRMAHLLMALIWTFAFLIALTPAIQWNAFYGANSLCFPLHFGGQFEIGWHYSAFVFIGLNFICLSIMTMSYAILFWKIRKTQLSTPIIVNDMHMALRFFLMVFIDFACLGPIIGVKIAGLVGFELEHLHSWMVILVIPVNALFNPLLYTIVTSKQIAFFKRVFIACHNRGHRNSTNTQSHFLPNGPDNLNGSGNRLRTSDEADKFDPGINLVNIGSRRASLGMGELNFEIKGQHMMRSNGRRWGSRDSGNSGNPRRPIEQVEEEETPLQQ